jgi:hypothetical protein
LADKPSVDVVPDREKEPGITWRTIARGWGAMLLIVSGIIFLVSSILTAFGQALMAIPAMLMVPFMILGGWLLHRGRAKRGPARGELESFERPERTVSLDEEARGVS